MLNSPLFCPSPQRKTQSALTRFLNVLNAQENLSLKTTRELHAFSVQHPERFWDILWDFCSVIGEKGGTPYLPNANIQEVRFFPEARLNYAENLLRPRPEGTALIFYCENKEKRVLSFSELLQGVTQCHHALKAVGVAAGDRVCGIVPNSPETLIFFLACASLGGIWSSCSPDFGVQGILDRFGQINPKVLVTCDGYSYGGKSFELLEKIKEVKEKLPSVEKVVSISLLGKDSQMAEKIPDCVEFTHFLAPHPKHSLTFEKLPFDHPLYILYSSGTTGTPKCIVHRAGGILLKHLSEHALHVDLTPKDRLFYFTTCGWMMWNWMVSALAVQASLVLYEGSPFFPDEKIFFSLLSEENVTVFGTSAKYLDSVRKTGFIPKDSFDFSNLKTLLSTGSPLSAEGFCEVYKTIKSDLHLASISGGTDICGCFVLGDPLNPVWPGELQMPAFGLDVDVFDEAGHTTRTQKGELVCKNAFPSMPLHFWNDADGKKYHSAYFDRFPNIWCHGDFAEWTKHDGFIIHGRSDATLNPGGVRIGTSEIYAQVEHFEEILESVAIGQPFDHDVRIVLFVKMKPGIPLEQALVTTIKQRIKTNVSPRHVPSLIIPVSDIPRTKSGKITELAIRDVILGKPVKNKEALANPEALDLYTDILSSY